MTDEQEAAQKRRRTPAEVEQVVSQFEGSGLNRSQFCRQQGLTLGTLNRYVKRTYEASTNSAMKGGLVAVELSGVKRDPDRGTGCGLAVVLASGRRIEVGASFDGPTLQRLVQVLETI
jgi:hypothetical protein